MLERTFTFYYFFYYLPPPLPPLNLQVLSQAALTHTYSHHISSSMCYPAPNKPSIQFRLQALKCRNNCSHSVKVSHYLKNTRAARQMCGRVPAVGGTVASGLRLQTKQE